MSLEMKNTAHEGDDRPTGMAVASATGDRARHGTFAAGIPYVTWGRGPRSLLFIAGEEAPTGLMLRMYRWLLRPYVDGGYTVWFVGRRHPMPSDYTVADMAGDYARVIREEFGGRVDLLVGESTGGMIGQYLAASHPASFGSIALVAAAAEVTDAGKDINLRSAEAVARGDRSAAGTILCEVTMAGERHRWLRRLIGPILGRGLPADQRADFLTAARALNAVDTRELLPRIRVPVLLVCGDRDGYFAEDVIEETARLIPDCALVWYRGRSHPQVVGSRRVARDVLAFVGRASSPAPGPLRTREVNLMAARPSDIATRWKIRRFERFVNRNTDSLTERFETLEVASMRREMLQEYKSLIPQVPYVGGRRNRWSSGLALSAWALAVYRVVARHGGDVQDAGRVAYDYVRGMVGRVPGPLRARMLGPRPARAQKQARWTQQRRYPGDWVCEVVDSAGQPFDLGMDVTECGIVKFLHAQGADELTPYLCHLDYVTAEAAGAGLTRTKTLAWGCDRCDFRFTIPGKTTATWPPEFVERSCGLPASQATP